MALPSAASRAARRGCFLQPQRPRRTRLGALHEGGMQGLRSRLPPLPRPAPLAGVAGRQPRRSHSALACQRRPALTSPARSRTFAQCRGISCAPVSSHGTPAGSKCMWTLVRQAGMAQSRRRRQQQRRQRSAGTEVHACRSSAHPPLLESRLRCGVRLPGGLVGRMAGVRDAMRSDKASTVPRSSEWSATCGQARNAAGQARLARLWEQGSCAGSGRSGGGRLASFWPVQPITLPLLLPDDRLRSLRLDQARATRLARQEDSSSRAVTRSEAGAPRIRFG